MSDLPVLIVDDNEFIRASMVKYLEHNGYKVMGACNGRDAISKMVDNHFSCIITDVLMPETDGFELIDHIRTHIDEKISETPIIAISGGGRTIDAGTALTILEEQADIILKKPFSKQDLLSQMSNLIKNGRQKEVVFIN